MISMTLPQYRRNECDIDGRRIRMKPCEADVLAILMVSNPAGFVTKETLIEAVWPDPDFEPDYALQSIWVRINWLRAKGVPIETAYTFGWRVPAYARAGNSKESVNFSHLEHSENMQEERLAA